MNDDSNKEPYPGFLVAMRFMFWGMGAFAGYVAGFIIIAIYVLVYSPDYSQPYDVMIKQQKAQQPFDIGVVLLSFIVAIITWKLVYGWLVRKTHMERQKKRSGWISRFKGAK